MAEETGLSKKTGDEELIKYETDSDDASEETEQIREQIEVTRSKMGETIDAIQERLSFENISEQVSEQVSEQASKAFQTAKESVYHATVGKAGEIMNNLNRELQQSTIINKAAANPLPLFFIALGAGLLFFGSGKKTRHTLDYRNNRNYREGGGGNKASMVKTAAGAVTGAASSAYESASNAAGSAYESAGDAAGTAYEGVTNFAGSAYEGVSNFAGSAAKKVGDLGTTAHDQYEHYINENPLAVGALAFAVGAGVGLAIPSTQYENELVGDARDQLMSKVKGSVSETINKVKNVADEAKNTLGEEAKKQDLI